MAVDENPGSLKSESSAAEVASAVGQFMSANDRVAVHYGMRLLSIDEGTAVVSMTVREDMQNALGICHGGIVFSLADVAFAYACNSRNRRTVALACTINFVAAPPLDEVLTACAREVAATGKTGIYDIAVTDRKGAVIAQFRGTSYSIGQPVV